MLDTEFSNVRSRSTAILQGPAFARRVPVDLATFREEMREVGVEEIVDVVLATFCEEMPGRMDTLRKMVARRNAGGIRSAAHAMKSGAGSIHAHELAGLLRQIEDLARHADVIGAISLMPSLMNEFRAVMDYLSD